jgi:hypothetical protein
LFLFPAVLPIFSTMLLILRGDRRCRRLFHAVAWALAAGLGLLYGMVSHTSASWALWGVWLYIGVAVSALILEIVTFSRSAPAGDERAG